MFKKIFIYLAAFVGGTIALLSGALAVFYYSDTVTEYTLEKVKSSVPGLSWDKVEGSLSSGITFTNLHYLSPSYAYNPEVTKKPEPAVDAEGKVIAGKEDKAPIATLVDVYIPRAVAGIKLSCIFTGDLCINKLEADNAQMLIAAGDPTREDNFAPDAYKNVSAEDLLPTLPEPEPGNFSLPSWVEISLTNAKIKNFNMVFGKNIGLAQMAINQKVYALLDKNPKAKFEGLPFQVTLAQLQASANLPASIYSPYLADPIHIQYQNLNLASFSLKDKTVKIDNFTSQQLSLALASNDGSKEAQALADAQAQAQAEIKAKVEAAKVAQEDKDNKGNSQNNNQGNSQENNNLDAQVQNYGFDAQKLKLNINQKVQEFFARYFNLGEGFSNSYSTLVKALPEDLKTKEAIQGLLAKNSTAEASKTSKEVREVKREKGASLPSAPEISALIDEKLAIFDTPLNDFLVDSDKKLRIPFKLVTNNIDLEDIKVEFQGYSNKNYVESLRKVADAKAKGRKISYPQANLVADKTEANKATENKETNKVEANQVEANQVEANKAEANKAEANKASYLGPLAQVFPYYANSLYQEQAEPFLPYLLYTSALVKKDDFNISSVKGSGQISAQAADFNLQLSGDLDAQVSVDYDAQSTTLDATITTQVHKLPLVKLPLGINASAKVHGNLKKAVHLEISNKDKNANLTIQGSVDTNQPQWPLDLKGQLESFEQGQIKIAPLNFHLSGQMTNLSADLDLDLSLNKKHFKSLLYLYWQDKNLNFDIKMNYFPGAIASDRSAWSKEDKAQGKTIIDFYGNFAWGNVLNGNIFADVKAFEAIDFVPLKGINSLQPEGQIAASLAYSQERDWSTLLNSNLVVGLNKQPAKVNLLAFADAVKGIELDNLDLSYLKNKVKGQGHLASDFNLHLQSQIKDLRTFVPKLNLDLDSDLSFQGTFTHPRASGYLYLNSLNFNNIALKDAKVDLDFDYDKQLAGEAKVSLGKSQVPGVTIEEVKLHLQGTPYDRLALKAKTSVADLDAMANNISYYPNGEFFTDLNINKLDVKAVDLRNLHTTQALGINYKTANNEINLSPFSLENKDLKISNRKTLVFVDNHAKGQLAVDRINLAFLNSTLKGSKTALYGVVDALLDFDLNVANLPEASNKVNLAINSPEITVKKVINFSTIKVEVSKLASNLTFNNNNLGLELNTLINRAPLTTNLNILQAFSNQRTLDGKFNLQNLSLELVKPFLDNTQIVGGDFSANLDIKGPLTKPELYGKAGIDRLKVAMLVMPFEVKEGKLDLDFQGEKALIKGNLPTDSQPIVLGGGANWQDYSNPQANLTLSTKNLKARILDFGHVLVNTDLKADFKDNALVLRGDTLLHDALLKVATVKSYLQPSGDVVLVDDKGRPLASKESSLAQLASNNGKTAETAIDIDAKLKVKVGDNVVFDAFGVNAYLGGALDIAYQENALSILGAITIPKGTFQQYGQSLIVQKGSAVFNGVTVIPTLDLRAIRNPDYVVDNVEVGVQVSGPATAPQISLFSNPNLPESQKINYLLTGSASDSSDGEVGLQLLSSTITSSLDFIGQIGNAFGIKNLQLSTAKSGEKSQVTLSGTVLKKVRVNYAYGLFNGLTELSGSYRLLPEIFLRLSYGVSAAIDAVWNKSW